MVDSKAWNWDEAKGQIWNEPSEDVYYYLHRWQQMGFKKFLDLGCGKGRHSHLFADSGFEVFSFDLSEKAISGFEVFSFDLSEKAINLVKNKAERRGQKIHVNIGDIKNLPYT
jgi:2-polyprenyl-3-methyl-5-hydroxy-6-metoxy-1,4-benzoquinol methylase